MGWIHFVRGFPNIYRPFSSITLSPRNGTKQRVKSPRYFCFNDAAFGPQHCEAMQSRRQTAKDAVLPSATPRVLVKKGRIHPKAKPATGQSSLKASPKPGGSCDGSPAEEDEDPKDAGHTWKRLQPDDLLFSEEEAPAESSNIFAGLTIRDLMNQEPIWKVPAIYRHDEIVDAIPGTASSDSEDDAQSDGKVHRDLDKMSVKDDSQKELEALQIATIVGLVDNFEVEIGGKKLTRKLLFLSNKQARMLPLNNLDKVMSGLDFYPRPKLVIQMCFSAAGGRYQYNRLTLTQHHWSKLAGEEVNRQHYWVSEENGLNGARDTEYKIQSFLKDCVIPMARQHKALVIVGQNDCSLSAVFGSLCEEEAERRRGQLGFYVLSPAQAPNVLEASHNPDSVAYQLRKSSKNWRSATDKMWYVLKKDRGAEAVNYYPYLDAPPGLLQTMLINQIPGFAIATLDGSDGLLSAKALADIVAREIPLLLLDSRDHKECHASVDEAIEELRDLDKRLNEAGTGNFYHYSTMAFLHQTLTDLLRQHRARARHIMKRVSSLKFASTASASKIGSQPSETVPLWAQIAALLEEASIKDSPESEAAPAQKEDDKKRLLAQKLTEKYLALKGERPTLVYPEWGQWRDCSDVPKEHFRDAQMRMMGQLVRCTSREMLDEFLAVLTLASPITVAVELGRSKTRKKLESGGGGSLFCKRYGLKRTYLWKELLQVAPGAHWEHAQFHLLGILKKQALGFEGWFQTRSYLQCSPEIKAAIIEVLMSPMTHSVNLGALSRIDRVLMQMHSDRRKPGIGRDLASCQILQRAWVDVDVYHHVATRMKYVAKVSYAMLLLTGYTITALTLVNMNIPEAIPADVANYCILGLSLSAGLTSALIAFLDPTTKWQKLRAAALALEAEIWKFRSCADVYSRDMTSSDVEAPEETLWHFIAAMEDSVLKSAGVSQTSFLSTFSFSRAPVSVKVYRHGQYEGAARAGTSRSGDPEVEDDHYSCLSAREYMALRFHSCVHFYQQRLPRYARWHAVNQAILAVASGLLTVLVYLGATHWCSACTAGTAALTAWSEFNATQRKMRRYSETVHEAHQILLWWQSLPRMQQTASFDLLVQRCEICFASENSSWVSSMNQRHGQRMTSKEDAPDDEQG